MVQLPKIALICVSGAALFSLASLAGQTEAHQKEIDATAGLRCEVVTRDLGDAIEIAGKVTSHKPVTGDYALVIRKSSESGEALIDQSGAFSVGQGRTKTLGTTTLSGASDAYDADLTLIINGERLTCLGAGAEIEI